MAPGLLNSAAAAGGIYFLSLALRTPAVGVGYTVWAGSGAVGTVLLGAVVRQERITTMKPASFAAILRGVIVLKLAAGA
ncbi:DMT family transporter [Kitasatospora herbaricolor]|uniref:SMR family transporter n=1 Tax=Kitasatospora herbaricolor TaxID=68217 RepID=A0ABZ1W337_9ACTN|nr:SMR family transporter [Kitasatospora herbaricolor]